ncbi:hypothetical protein FRC09_006929 [Ceratobasidium sp. 395]|nr:hypothetical protein FRC09_006929 [Ceratobasidium sp. 395]
MREQWKDELGGHYGTLCRCFEAWIKYHFNGPHVEAEWDAIDVVTKANTFAKKAFLHGSAKVAPRHPVRPTIGRRLSATSQFVSDLGLEDAVTAKILVVEEFDE